VRSRGPALDPLFIGFLEGRWGSRTHVDPRLISSEAATSSSPTTDACSVFPHLRDESEGEETWGAFSVSGLAFNGTGAALGGVAEHDARAFAGGRGAGAKLAAPYSVAGGGCALERGSRLYAPVRLTRRTALVLGAIAARPGQSNRLVARGAGLGDEGQASRLLQRLARRGLIENVGLGAAHGQANAWVLTAAGRRTLRSTGVMPAACVTFRGAGAMWRAGNAR
jgi:hypothetical protein